jgi:hypothetical protein
MIPLWLGLLAAEAAKAPGLFGIAREWVVGIGGLATLIAAGLLWKDRVTASKQKEHIAFLQEEVRHLSSGDVVAALKRNIEGLQAKVAESINSQDAALTGPLEATSGVVDLTPVWVSYRGGVDAMGEALAALETLVDTVGRLGESIRQGNRSAAHEHTEEVCSGLEGIVSGLKKLNGSLGDIGESFLSFAVAEDAE